MAIDSSDSSRSLVPSSRGGPEPQWTSVSTGCSYPRALDARRLSRVDVVKILESEDLNAFGSASLPAISRAKDLVCISVLACDLHENASQADSVGGLHTSPRGWFQSCATGPVEASDEVEAVYPRRHIHRAFGELEWMCAFTPLPVAAVERSRDPDISRNWSFETLAEERKPDEPAPARDGNVVVRPRLSVEYCRFSSDSTGTRTRT